MKERGILFSAPMVRALLAGTKTQTRRKYKPRAPEPYEVMSERPDGAPWPYCEYPDTMNGYEPVSCPYGDVGDRLWVRETWRYDNWTEDGYPFIGYAAGGRRLAERIPAEWADRVNDAWAALSEADNFAIDQRAADRKWRPSIFLPRWASRITLEVTDVRVQRLQDISEDDADAEGVAELDGTIDEAELYPIAREMRLAPEDSRVWYRWLWESINGAGSWDANPWVWAVSFRRLP